jgi:adenosylcobinamide kinase/adenosylcobinamide-phosphate guanylyltransferase
MKRVVLITGGGRSGKSRHALELTAPYEAKAFIATAEPIDEEMRVRIDNHRRERDSSYRVVEEPVDLAAALKNLPQGTGVALVDCITVWLGNLLHRQKIKNGNCLEIEAFLGLIVNPPCDLVLVTNEVGMGIVPADEATRLFRDLAGNLNKELAHRAHQVVLMVSGIPLRLK